MMMTLIHTAIDAMAQLPAGTIPDPAPVQPPGTAGITTLISWVKWIGFAIVGVAIILGGVMVAVGLRRGEGQDAATKIVWPFAGAIVIGGGISMVSALIGG